MMDLQGAYNQALSLENTGTREPNIKLAVWAAILSANNSLGMNGRQVRLLAKFANTKGVTLQDIKQALKGTYASKNIIGYLLGAQYLWELGELDAFLITPDDEKEWLDWREALVSMVNGLGYKTASMVALLLWPTTSPLAVVDRHVINRLGIKNSKGNTPTSLRKNTYLSIERQLDQEKQSAGFKGPLVIWHWYKWEEHRQVNSKSIVKTGDYESHNALSCRDY